MCAIDNYRNNPVFSIGARNVSRMYLSPVGIHKGGLHTIDMNKYNTIIFIS